MAESVDALVSNTSGAIRPGSTPGLGTSKTTKSLFKLLVVFFLFVPILFPHNFISTINIQPFIFFFKSYRMK